MSAVVGFWTMIGAYMVAVALSLAGEFARKGRLGSLLAAVALCGGGVVGLVTAWTSQAVFVRDAFVAGSGFSAVAGMCGVLVSAAVLADRDSAPEHAGQRSALMALATLGAALVCQAADLVTLLLTLEVAAVCGYAIVATDKTKFALESSMKYFIQGAVATGLMVTATAVFLGVGGSGVSYFELNRAVGTTHVPALQFAMALFVAGVGFKAGAAPFHSWVPDAYQSAPPPGGAVLAGAVKASAITALISVVGAIGLAGVDAENPMGAVGTTLLPLLGLIAALSISVGAFAALKQRSFLRMLGYAGVAQVGFAVMGIAAGNPRAALVAVVTYAVAATGAFLVAQVLRSSRADWDGTIDGMAGTGRSNPVVGAAITVLMMSLAGVPPLLGFWGKLQVLQAGVAFAASWWLQGNVAYAIGYGALVAVGVIGSVVSIAYYGSVIRAVYDCNDSVSPATGVSRFVVITFGIAVAALGVGMMLVPPALALRGFIL